MTKTGKIVFGAIDQERVQGLLFDVDGTLNDTDDQMIDSLTRFFQPVSWLFKNSDPRSFSRWFVKAVETPANFVYGLTDRLGIDSVLIRLHQNLTQRRKVKQTNHEQFMIVPGVKAMLEKLNSKFPMAVVSSRDGQTTHQFLEYFDLLPYFKVVVTSQTCQHTKPSPDPILYAAEQLGLDARDCLMIGDTIVDVRAGRSAGAQTVGVLCGFGTQRELRRAGADLILSDTSDLVHSL
ncbi:MAG: HAD family hydrolase [Chloroflexota bacterium]|nr:HAD family hydrolase [Chloroflexota bacterium]